KNKDYIFRIIILDPLFSNAFESVESGIAFDNGSTNLEFRFFNRPDDAGCNGSHYACCVLV
ncbi:MAG: hypothetical protein K0U82_14115, partial [Planctomycetes bacterium]|nr:hypothetical protein [Planctomycetota bacterium]